jgi:hypothetical protein
MFKSYLYVRAASRSKKTLREQRTNLITHTRLGNTTCRSGLDCQITALPPVSRYSLTPESVAVSGLFFKEAYLITAESAVLTWAGFSVEGDSREDVLLKLDQQVKAQLADGEIAYLDLPLAPTKNPWLAIAKKYQDDPNWKTRNLE